MLLSKAKDMARAATKTVQYPCALFRRYVLKLISLESGLADAYRHACEPRNARCCE
jgi:hypothetical protein